MNTTMWPTVRALAEVAETLVPVTGSRHSDEAIPTVHQQTTASSAAHERRVTSYSRIQSRWVNDAVPSQNLVHRQLVVRRST